MSKDKKFKKKKLKNYVKHTMNLINVSKKILNISFKAE